MAYDWAPSVEDVGAILRARTTKSETGEELGTFTDETRPTSTAVVSLIDDATDDVVSAVGGQVPKGLERPARRTATIRAAMLVELTYFQEQLETGQSSYPQLREWYTEQLAVLTGRIDDTTGTDADGSFGTPLFGFPVECQPMDQVRW